MSCNFQNGFSEGAVLHFTNVPKRSGTTAPVQATLEAMGFLNAEVYKGAGLVQATLDCASDLIEEKDYLFVIY